MLTHVASVLNFLQYNETRDVSNFVSVKVTKESVTSMTPVSLVQGAAGPEKNVMEGKRLYTPTDNPPPRGCTSVDTPASFSS